MTTKRVTGTDGKLAVITKGTAIEGDSSTPLAAGFYLADVVLGTGSGLPTNMVAKKVFQASTASATTPATGETVTPLTFTDWCFAQNVSFETPKGEINITTLCDDYETYAAGRLDLSGSFDGIVSVGDDTDEGTKVIIKKFFDTVTQSADLGSVEITNINNDNVYLKIDVNKESTTGENTAFFLIPATLTSFSDGVTTADAQTFTTSYRKAQDETIDVQYVENIQPVV